MASLSEGPKKVVKIPGGGLGESRINPAAFGKSLRQLQDEKEQALSDKQAANAVQGSGGGGFFGQITGGLLAPVDTFLAPGIATVKEATTSVLQPTENLLTGKTNIGDAIKDTATAAASIAENYNPLALAGNVMSAAAGGSGNVGQDIKHGYTAVKDYVTDEWKNLFPDAPPPPTVEAAKKPEVMPEIDAEAIARIRRRRAMQAMAGGSGRANTILSSSDTLGG